MKTRELLRLFILLSLVLVICFYFIPSLEIWCYERYQLVQQRWQGWYRFVQDDDYNIPESDREPHLVSHSMSEFRHQQQAVASRFYEDTVMRWPNQIGVGNVFQDGHHTALPDGYRWQSSKLVRLNVARR